MRTTGTRSGGRPKGASLTSCPPWAPAGTLTGNGHFLKASVQVIGAHQRGA